MPRRRKHRSSWWTPDNVADLFDIAWEFAMGLLRKDA